MSEGPESPPTIQAEQSPPRLTGAYYAHCQQVFRRATNQSDRMLAELERLAHGRKRLSVLSVGSGSGLFEIPLLEQMDAEGDGVDRFVGIDPDPHACHTLEQRLRRRFADQLDYQVQQRSFEDFRSRTRVDLVLFVHTFEYLSGDQQRWLERARRLTAPGGQMVIFSPQRGGINAIYEQVTDGCFSDDLVRLLRAAGFPYRATQIQAECDIVALNERNHPDREALLSFLTQLDCRALDPTQRKEFADYYRSLAGPGGSKLPHPTTLFEIAG